MQRGKSNDGGLRISLRSTTNPSRNSKLNHCPTVIQGDPFKEERYSGDLDKS